MHKLGDLCAPPHKSNLRSILIEHRICKEGGLSVHLLRTGSWDGEVISKPAHFSVQFESIKNTQFYLHGFKKQSLLHLLFLDVVKQWYHKALGK